MIGLDQNISSRNMYILRFFFNSSCGLKQKYCLIISIDGVVKFIIFQINNIVVKKRCDQHNNEEMHHRGGNRR